MRFVGRGVSVRCGGEKEEGVVPERMSGGPSLKQRGIAVTGSNLSESRTSKLAPKNPKKG